MCECRQLKYLSLVWMSLWWLVCDLSALRITFPVILETGSRPTLVANMQRNDMAVRVGYNATFGCNKNPSNYRVGCEKDRCTVDYMISTFCLVSTSSNT